MLRLLATIPFILTACSININELPAEDEPVCYNEAFGTITYTANGETISELTLTTQLTSQGRIVEQKDTYSHCDELFCVQVDTFYVEQCYKSN